jgi:uncharacterized lipoprotein NlpE involved in copper resistance
MKRHFSGSFFLLLVSFTVLSFVACGDNDGSQSEVEEVRLELVKIPDTVHSTQNSVDFAGTYKGITPCADCEGIEVELTINMDSTYSHSMKYLGKGDGQPLVKTGKYVWIDGGTIQLEGVADGPSKFKVGEGRIWQLDMQGNKIEGEMADKYILNKTN